MPEHKHIADLLQEYAFPNREQQLQMLKAIGAHITEIEEHAGVHDSAISALANRIEQLENRRGFIARLKALLGVKWT